MIVNPVSPSATYLVETAAQKVEVMLTSASTTFPSSRFVGVTPYAAAVTADGTKIWILDRGADNIYKMSISGASYDSLGAPSTVALSGIPLGIFLVGS